jgi:hypothetical protein
MTNERQYDPDERVTWEQALYERARPFSEPGPRGQDSVPSYLAPGRFVGVWDDSIWDDSKAALALSRKVTLTTRSIRIWRWTLSPGHFEADAHAFFFGREVTFTYVHATGWRLWAWRVIGAPIYRLKHG